MVVLGTGAGVTCLVFPYSNSRSGPYIVMPRRTSAGVLGQLG